MSQGLDFFRVCRAARNNCSQLSCVSLARLESTEWPDSARSAQGDIAATPPGRSRLALRAASATAKARPPPASSPTSRMEPGGTPLAIMPR